MAGSRCFLRRDGDQVVIVCRGKPHRCVQMDDRLTKPHLPRELLEDAPDSSHDGGRPPVWVVGSRLATRRGLWRRPWWCRGGSGDPDATKNQT